LLLLLLVSKGVALWLLCERLPQRQQQVAQIACDQTAQRQQLRLPYFDLVVDAALGERHSVG